MYVYVYINVYTYTGLKNGDVPTSKIKQVYTQLSIA